MKQSMTFTFLTYSALLFLAGCDDGTARDQELIQQLQNKIDVLEQQLSQSSPGGIANLPTDTMALQQKVMELEKQLSEQNNKTQPLVSETLAQIRQKGYLQCGVSTGLPGFSYPNDKGEWNGLDVELCQAVAAAALGDKNMVKYIPLTAKERFTSLQSGDIDILSRNTTWTLNRDTALGLNFAGINYYDGQGFMIHKSLEISKATELDGARICVQAGTTTELNLEDYFRFHEIRYTSVPFDTASETVKGFEAGKCDALTADQSGLYSLRLHLAEPETAVVLADIISKEPLGPVVRQGDDLWFNIVKWTLFTMIQAEELGVSSHNVDDMKASNDPDILRLIGLSGPKGKGLGLNDDWSYQVIKQVGNYGESFERTVGMRSSLKIKRGLNALWSDGGLQYAPPLR